MQLAFDGGYVTRILKGYVNMAAVIRKNFRAFLDNDDGSVSPMCAHEVARFKDDIIPGRPLFLILLHRIIIR